MNGFITEEDLGAFVAYESGRIGHGSLWRKIFPRPSDEKILRMFRLKMGTISKNEYRTRNTCELLDHVGLGNALRWLTFLDYDDAKEEATSNVVEIVSYGR